MLVVLHHELDGEAVIQPFPEPWTNLDQPYTSINACGMEQ